MENGKIILKMSVQHVTRDDYLEENLKKQIEDFNNKLDENLNDKNYEVDLSPEFESMYLDDVEDDDVYPNPGVTHKDDTTPTAKEYGDMISNEWPKDDDEEAIDKYLNVELILKAGTNNERQGWVIKHAKGSDGKSIGHAHKNPMFDTREYEVEFTNGMREKYQANVIAKNMFAQVDSEGHQYQILDEIVDHRSDTTIIPISEGMIQNANRTKKPKITMRGWQHLVRFKDGSLSWVKLKDIKELNPVEVVEYAVANRIAEEPAYKWWVLQVLWRRNCIILKVKGWYWHTTHKFGIHLPHSAEEALRLDEESGTNHWRHAINKEMSKVKVALEAREDVTPEQAWSGKVLSMVRFQEIGCHLIFDVKMDFTRKARFVVGGHTMKAPSSITYSSVVSRDSVQLAFLIASLHNVDILSCNLENAYLNAKCREKIWFEGGIECGNDAGKVCIVVHVLYGLKSSGTSWRSTLASLLSDLGYTLTKANPNVWIRKAVRPDGYDYYEMLLVYVNNILSVSHQAQEAIDEVILYYKAKEWSVNEPDRYLGADVAKFQLPNGRMVWTTSPRSYVKNVVQVIKCLLSEDGEGYSLKSKVKNPFPTDYKPELDVTNKLSPELTSWFMQLIGILWWAIELGRINIFLEVSMLSQYQVNPRLGHLEAAYYIFSYLKGHLDMGQIAYNPKNPDVDESVFNLTADWTDFYRLVEEQMPTNMPEPRGKPITISAFVNVNHAGNVVTQCSHTGIIIFVQNAPIIWFSKWQNMVESVMFGSELVAQRICKEMIVALWYKLWMFGVDIDGWQMYSVTIMEL